MTTHNVEAGANPTPEVNLQASNPDFEFDALDDARNYRKALFRAFQPYVRGTVLEVGSGIGQFSKELLKHPALKSLYAVEPDSRFHSRLSAYVPHSNIVKGTAAAITKLDAWDCVVSINVLEHIEKDREELTLYARLLKTDGHLCLFVPARQEIYSSIDKDFGHFRRYTTDSLRQLLRETGFEPISCRYFNFVGYFAWWLNFRVLRRRHFSKFNILFFDRVVFPLSHALELLLGGTPVGQSAVVIARPISAKNQ